MFTQGNQLRRDLNVIVASGKNWKIPALWAPLIRYISSPILFIIYSFAYPEFWTLRNDPVYVFGFILAHLCIVAMVVCVLAPRFFDPLIPIERRDDGVRKYAPNVTEGLIEAEVSDAVESGSGDDRRLSEEIAKGERA